MRVIASQISRTKSDSNGIAWLLFLCQNTITKQSRQPFLQYNNKFTW